MQRNTIDKLCIAWNIVEKLITCAQDDDLTRVARTDYHSICSTVLTAVNLICVTDCGEHCSYVSDESVRQLHRHKVSPLMETRRTVKIGRSSQSSATRAVQTEHTDPRKEEGTRVDYSTTRWQLQATKNLDMNLAY